MTWRRLKAGAVLALVAGCAGTPEPAARPTDEALEAAVDSVTAAELARFREGLTEPDSLAAGAASRDALVERYVRALEANDTAALVRLHLTDAEFAWFYYPTSPYARRPYRQDPALFWLLLRGNSEKGIARALRSYGGRATGYAGVACEAAPAVYGANRLWERCIAMLRPERGGEAAPLRLFGSILERDGRFKFVSYANDL